MTKARNLADNALTTVSPTELGYLDGVTSAVQTQLDAKLATATASTTYLANALVDAKGDVLTATADNTPARLAVGTDGQVLTAASGQSTGLQWATPAAGGMTLLASGSLSTNTVTISSISGAYIDLVLYIRGISYATSGRTYVRINGNSDASYRTYMQNYSNVTNVVVGGATNWYLVNADTDGSASAHATLRFPDYSVSSNSKHFQGQLTTTYSESVSYLFHGYHSTITDAISSITILTPFNTFDAGTYVLYGVK